MRRSSYQIARRYARNKKVYNFLKSLKFLNFESFDFLYTFFLIAVQDRRQQKKKQAEDRIKAYKDKLQALGKQKRQQEKASDQNSQSTTVR